MKHTSPVQQCIIVMAGMPDLWTGGHQLTFVCAGLFLVMKNVNHSLVTLGCWGHCRDSCSSSDGFSLSLSALRLSSNCRSCFRNPEFGPMSRFRRTAVMASAKDRPWQIIRYARTTAPERLTPMAQCTNTFPGKYINSCEYPWNSIPTDVCFRRFLLQSEAVSNSASLLHDS